MDTVCMYNIGPKDKTKSHGPGKLISCQLIALNIQKHNNFSYQISSTKLLCYSIIFLGGFLRRFQM